MLDLKPRVHLHEPDPVRAKALRSLGDEFDGPRPHVVHSLCRLDRGRADSHARRRIHPRRRRLLDHLLMAALERAVAFEQMHHVSVAVAEHLHLDVARPQDIFFDQHAIVAEGRGRLAAAALKAIGEVLPRVDPAHTLAAASGDRLDQHRITDLIGFGLKPVQALVIAQIPRCDRHAGIDHQTLGRVLQPHGPDRGRRGADPYQPLGLDGLGEVGVLGQEAIPRMNRRRAGRLGGGQDLRLVEIAFARGGRPDTDGFVRFAHERHAGVHVGMDRDRADAHSTGGAYDPARDLAPVGDQQTIDHRITSGRRRSARAPEWGRSGSRRRPGPVRRGSGPDR